MRPATRHASGGHLGGVSQIADAAWVSMIATHDRDNTARIQDCESDTLVEGIQRCALTGETRDRSRLSALRRPVRKQASDYLPSGSMAASKLTLILWPSSPSQSMLPATRASSNWVISTVPLKLGLQSLPLELVSPFL